MYDLKISEDDLCMLINYVGRHLIKKLKYSHVTKEDFEVVSYDFQLLSYLLSVFGYDGNVYDYLHNVGLDDEYIIDLIVPDSLFE